MKKVYIAGPYRAGHGRTVLQNIRAAELVAIKYWFKGYAVFCPHLNSAFLDGICLDDNFILADLLFLEICDVVVMMPNFRESKGAVAEHAYAKGKGKEIIYES